MKIVHGKSSNRKHNDPSMGSQIVNGLLSLIGRYYRPPHSLDLSNWFNSPLSAPSPTM